MRDLHVDGEYLRDFNAASKQWAWASWHELQATQDLTAQRLLNQVFGREDEPPSAESAIDGER